jgi:hypothetical protein
MINRDPAIVNNESCCTTKLPWFYYIIMKNSIGRGNQKNSRNFLDTIKYLRNLLHNTHLFSFEMHKRWASNLIRRGHFCDGETFFWS